MSSTIFYHARTGVTGYSCTYRPSRKIATAINPPMITTAIASSTRLMICFLRCEESGGKAWSSSSSSNKSSSAGRTLVGVGLLTESLPKGRLLTLTSGRKVGARRLDAAPAEALPTAGRPVEIDRLEDTEGLGDNAVAGRTGADLAGVDILLTAWSLRPELPVTTGRRPALTAGSL